MNYTELMSVTNGETGFITLPNKHHGSIEVMIPERYMEIAGRYHEEGADIVSPVTEFFLNLDYDPENKIIKHGFVTRETFMDGVSRFIKNEDYDDHYSWHESLRPFIDSFQLAVKMSLSLVELGKHDAEDLIMQAEKRTVFKEFLDTIPDSIRIQEPYPEGIVTDGMTFFNNEKDLIQETRWITVCALEVASQLSVVMDQIHLIDK